MIETGIETIASFLPKRALTTMFLVKSMKHCAHHAEHRELSCLSPVLPSHKLFFCVTTIFARNFPPTPTNFFKKELLMYVCRFCTLWSLPSMPFLPSWNCNRAWHRCRRLVPVTHLGKLCATCVVVSAPCCMSRCTRGHTLLAPVHGKTCPLENSMDYQTVIAVSMHWFKYYCLN